MKSIGVLLLAAGAAAVAFLLGKKKGEPVPQPIGQPGTPGSPLPNVPLPVPPQPGQPVPGGGRATNDPEFTIPGAQEPPPPLMPLPPFPFDLGWKPLPGDPPASGAPKPPGWPDTVPYPPPPPTYWPKNIPWPPVSSSQKPYGWPSWLAWPPAAPTQPPTLWPLGVPFPVPPMSHPGQ